MIVQAMLEDKMRETDWEVTQDSINEQVARESYLQWLHEQEKRQNHESVSSEKFVSFLDGSQFSRIDNFPGFSLYFVRDKLIYYF